MSSLFGEKFLGIRFVLGLGAKTYVGNRDASSPVDQKRRWHRPKAIGSSRLFTISHHPIVDALSRKIRPHGCPTVSIERQAKHAQFVRIGLLELDEPRHL